MFDPDYLLKLTAIELGSLVERHRDDSNALAEISQHIAAHRTTRLAHSVKDKADQLIKENIQTRNIDLTGITEAFSKLLRHNADRLEASKKYAEILEARLEAARAAASIQPGDRFQVKMHDTGAIRSFRLARDLSERTHRVPNSQEIVVELDSPFGSMAKGAILGEILTLRSECILMRIEKFKDCRHVVLSQTDIPEFDQGITAHLIDSHDDQFLDLVAE